MAIPTLAIMPHSGAASASEAQAALPGGEIDPIFLRGEELADSAQPEQGLTYLNYALELAEREFGPDGPELVPYLTGLASLYSRLGDIEDAEPLYLKVIALGAGNADIQGEGLAAAVQDLGAIYEITEREPAARQLYIDVLKTWQSVLGKEHEAVEVARDKLSALDGPTAVASLEGVEPPADPGDLKMPEYMVGAPESGGAGDGGAADSQAGVATSGDTGADTGAGDTEAGDTQVSAAQAGGDAAADPGSAVTQDGAEAGKTAGDSSQIGSYKGEPQPLAPTGDTSAKDAPAASDPQVASLPRIEDGASAGLEPLPGYRVHLMSVRSADGARGEWERVRQENAELLGKLSLEIEEVDLGAEKGRWYRILAGPLSKKKANEICRALEKKEIYCQVRPPRDLSFRKGSEGVALAQASLSDASGSEMAPGSETATGVKPDGEAHAGERLTGDVPSKAISASQVAASVAPISQVPTSQVPTSDLPVSQAATSQAATAQAATSEFPASAIADAATGDSGTAPHGPDSGTAAEAPGQDATLAARPSDAALSGIDPSERQMHLSSVRRVESTLPEWQRLQKVFGVQLSGLDLRVRRVYLGELGRWHRIFAGPVGAKDGENRCVEIRKQGQWCKVMPDHGEVVVVTVPVALSRPAPKNRSLANRRPNSRAAKDALRRLRG